jgi:small Trp-rich protein
MPMLIIGVLMVALKLAEIGPFEKMSWFWVAVPFLLSIFWWELIEPLFGLDKKKEHQEAEYEKKKTHSKMLNKKK